MTFVEVFEEREGSGACYIPCCAIEKLDRDPAVGWRIHTRGGGPYKIDDAIAAQLLGRLPPAAKPIAVPRRAPAKGFDA